MPRIWHIIDFHQFQLWGWALTSSSEIDRATKYYGIQKRTTTHVENVFHMNLIPFYFLISWRGSYSLPSQSFPFIITGIQAFYLIWQLACIKKKELVLVFIFFDFFTLQRTVLILHFINLSRPDCFPQLVLLK